MTRHSTLDLARVGYDAYGDQAGWTNHAGNAMPRWRELPQAQRKAWVAAAEAIGRALITCPERSSP